MEPSSGDPPPAPAVTDLLVPPSHEGWRLDAFLADTLRVSRGEARRLLRGGRVRVRGRPATELDKGVLLPAGTAVWVTGFARERNLTVMPETHLPLVLLARGDGWLAVDKPTGMPVHPLEPGARGTVLNAAVARYPELQGVGEGGLRSGIVHRLDVETTGVLLLATREDRWRAFRDAFRTHRAEKVYRAAVVGRLTGEARVEVDLYVAQHRPAKVRVAARRPHPRGTRRCDLAWRALAPLRGATLVEVRLGTGFLHQIRAMMAHLGHPVAGDRLYGAPPLADDPPRPLLHAARLRAHDAAAESPDPPDFATWLERNRA